MYFYQTFFFRIYRMFNISLFIVFCFHLLFPPFSSRFFPSILIKDVAVPGPSLPEARKHESVRHKKGLGQSVTGRQTATDLPSCWLRQKSSPRGIRDAPPVCPFPSHPAPPRCDKIRPCKRGEEGNTGGEKKRVKTCQYKVKAK